MSASNNYGHYNPYDALDRNGSIRSQQNRRENDPLPPVPSASPRPPYPYLDTRTPVQPVASPFEDHSPSHSSLNNYSLFAADTSYHGGQSSLPLSYHHDPFADANAVPLQRKQDLDGPGGSSPTARDAENRSLRRDSDGSGRRHRRRSPAPRGPWYTERTAYFVWVMTTMQVIVFIAEIVRNAQLTNSPIEIHPSFNPMIGPSPYVLINMGARYVPCMRNTAKITDHVGTVLFQCPNTTTIDAKCQLSDLCGFGGVPNPDPNNASLDRKPEPDQWFRFIVPIFLHAGIIHIGFNMLLQVTLGREMELIIGSVRFALVYFSTGIFGFVFGGNFAPPGIASTGASGCLFGVLALTLLDLLYNWAERPNPVRELMFIFADVVISFVLGLLPGLDNFSHIGGFLMGLALGICILHSPASLRQRIGEDSRPGSPPYSAVPIPCERRRKGDGAVAFKSFARQSLGFFKGRKPAWWAWWLVRAGALVGIVIIFIILLRNFYTYRTECRWCKYLSCLPIKNWCDLGQIQFQSPNQKLARHIFALDAS